MDMTHSVPHIPILNKCCVVCWCSSSLNSINKIARKTTQSTTN
ncbi:MAG: hypothetical protein ACJARP_003310 [Vicingaceae bacterium]